MSSVKRREHVVSAAPDAEIQEQETGKAEFNNELGLQYTIEDTPPWYLAILLGFQV